MTLIWSTPRRTAGAGSDGGRDRAIDVVRALCLVIVVLLHAMMVGVSVVGGFPLFENAMDRWDGFALASWVVQVMPLFFILGGFSSITHWTKLQARGETWAGYVATRLRRLLPAAAAAMAATALALAVLAVTGVDGGLLAVAGFRMSQPLWFLGVYILCTLMVPPLVTAHRRAPVVTLALLAGAVVAVDVIRMSTGIEAVGFANLVFVWLLMQQIGFAVASLGSRAIAPAVLATVAGAAVILLVALMLVGWFPTDFYEALNPPTASLVLLGIVHLTIVLAARDALERIAGHPAVAALAGVINTRAMTIYAWHMPVLIMLAGATLVGWTALPAPVSLEWWLSRPLWLTVAAMAVIGVVAWAHRFDRAPVARLQVGAGRALCAALIAAGGVVLILVAGSALESWVVGAVALAGALRLVSARTTAVAPAR